MVDVAVELPQGGVMSFGLLAKHRCPSSVFVVRRGRTDAIHSWRGLHTLRKVSAADGAPASPQDVRRRSRSP